MTGPQLPQVGALVKLRFSLEGAGDFEFNAVVRHLVHGCGVEFMEVLPEEQLRLIAYLEKYLFTGRIG